MTHPSSGSVAYALSCQSDRCYIDDVYSSDGGDTDSLQYWISGAVKHMEDYR